MKLFTADLDRTLIFSNRTIAKDESERICIEMLDDQSISYVTETIKERLTEIHHTLQFVPVTTRSREQFERISLFQQDIIPEVAVVANGGIILRNGQVDERWEQHIQQVMENIQLPIKQIQQHFQHELAAPYFLHHQQVDELFFVYYVNLAQVDLAEIQHLKSKLNACGWSCYLQGRKFYVVPQEITKGAAVAYLKNHTNYDKHYAAGDSLLDVSMMYLADRSFAPLHGEIADYPEKYGDIEIIKKKGAFFAEHCLLEILQNI
ncbi:hypothetical protein CSE16_17120 [Solibacillus sp. R5-41]|uniref:HAD family hydrolase n=1 Tax=Solibacillus sp. R5-41 TaxID=2048654 RepID=UPI000C1266D8|nr:HAD family hydrolase [Solibacillus sp. R5-41]ATP41617.1 hypothetical protein CSE16_17120 [Solibacillus sp. R5-41]